MLSHVYGVVPYQFTQAWVMISDREPNVDFMRLPIVV
jgi:hypothetical protein